MRRTAPPLMVILAAVAVAAPPPVPSVVSARTPVLAGRAFALGGEAREGAQLSADGSRFAVGLKKSVAVYDLTKTPPILIREVPGGPAALSPSGRLVLANGGEVVDVATGKTVATVRGATAKTTRFAVFPTDDRVAVVGSAARPQVFVWDVAKDAEVGTADLPAGAVTHVAAAKGGKEVWVFRPGKADAGRQLTVDRVDVSAAPTLARTVTPEQLTKARFTTLYLASSDPGGTLIAGEPVGADSSASDGGILYDATTGKVTGRLPPDVSPFGGGLFGPTLHFGAVQGGVADRAFGVVYDWKAKRAVALLRGFTDGNKRSAGSADGSTVVQYDTVTGDALAWDVLKRKPAKKP